MAIEEKRMKQLQADAATWGLNDITPLAGEFACEVATPYRVKLGDGVNAFSALPYVSRRDSTEFDADTAAYLLTASVDVSTGAADAGKLVLLDSAGLVDSSMLPSLATVAWNFLGAADFTASIPAAPGGSYGTGDVYFNTADGQTDPTWGWPDDVTNAAQPGVFVGDLAYYDLDKGGVGVPGWRLLAGEKRLMYLIDRDFANDGAAAAGGVPVGGTYRNGNAVQVRVV